MAISCDPSSLANAARCFDLCQPKGIQESVKSYLLCQYANKGVGPATPAIPGNIDINAENSVNGSTIVTWANSDVPTTNEIWRSKNNAAFVLAGTVAGTQHNFTDVTVLAGTDLFTYKVRACSGATCSAFTSTVSAANNIHPSAGGPVSPADLIITYGDFDESNNPAIVAILQPLLRIVAGAFTVAASNALTSITCSALKSVGTSVFLDSNSLSSFSANSLVTVGADISMNGSAMVNFSLPALISVGGDFTCTSNAALVSFSVPSFTTLGGNMNWNSNAVLATTTLPVFLIADGATIDWHACAITAGNSAAGTGINGILHRGVVSATTVSDYELNLGTNAAPTGQGVADKATLAGAGNTVNTN